MQILFFILAAVALISGGLVVFQRHPLRSALWLIVNFFAVAGIYLLAHAEFIAAIQVIVYAGAIMVLFLFVIMLLDLKEEQRRKIKMFGFVGGLVSVGAIILIALRCLRATNLNAQSPLTLEGGTAELGNLLFKQYVLPFEVVSVLLLVAMVGVILLSKKDLK